MDLNKLLARVVVELKSASYLSELIRSVLTILTEAGAIPPSAKNVKLAESLETLIQSELFDVALAKLLIERRPPNVPGTTPASWAGDLNNPAYKAPK
jgi:hypothetical protein